MDDQRVIRRRGWITTMALGAALVGAGCGGSAGTVGSAPEPGTAVDTAAPAPASSAAPSPAPTSIATTTPPPEPSTPAPMSLPEPTASTVDDSWRAEVATVCARGAAEVAARPSLETTSATDVVAAVRAARDGSVEAIAFPPELRRAPSDVIAVYRQQEQPLAEAEAAAAAGDVAAVGAALEHYDSLGAHNAALVTVAGVECVGDPARAANAAMNVPVPGVWQVAMGFGSVWASQRFATTISRVDATTGEVLATIDVGALAVKAQPADGRMIVRTADAYVAIDPTTDTVVATLPKPDVGPAADRSWAVDGAMWICDGQRVHRYDPATLQPTGAVVDLGIDCGQVYATAELVIAWTYNDDDGESGAAAAAFIDPGTNQVLATTPLPSDVTVPIVLDDAVFFPANLGTVSAVVDRASWQVVATPTHGRMVGGSQVAYDGRSIYLIADRVDVLVIDAETYEQTDVIEPLTIVPSLNALAAEDGALWVATGITGILQRFDTSS